MFPGRINSHFSSPPLNNGGAENVPSSNSGPSQSQSQSTRSRAKPRTLDDLPDHRAILLQSQNPAAKILGEALKKVHDQFKTGAITSTEHLGQCYEIREAAEMLNGSLDVEEEVMHHQKLSGMTPERNALSSREYLAINDELDVQLDPERGVEAVRQRTLDNTRRASRGRGNFEINIGANQTAQSPMLSPPIANSLNMARDAINRGVSADQAIADNGLTHPEDVRTIREAAARVAASGGPRAPARAWLAASQAVGQGVSADQAIADNGLTHPEDVRTIREAAARAVGNRR